MSPSRDAVLAALAKVIDPELQQPVTELNMVRDVEIDDGIVSLTIVLTIAGCPLRDSFERQVEAAFADVPGVRGFSLSFAVMTPEERQALTTKLRGGVERSSEIRLPRDCRVIAVASGKGGVGKSSLTANLAVAFSRLGKRTGVIDADIYGHSIPHILGIHQMPVAVDQLIVPPVKDGL
jgi:ATP-binding protein involved in chromosome partitioning